jgi:hypothetical protein
MVPRRGKPPRTVRAAVAGGGDQLVLLPAAPGVDIRQVGRGGAGGISVFRQSSASDHTRTAIGQRRRAAGSVSWCDRGPRRTARLSARPASAELGVRGASGIVVLRVGARAIQPRGGPRAATCELVFAQCGSPAGGVSRGACGGGSGMRRERGTTRRLARLGVLPAPWDAPDVLLGV